MFCKLSYLPYNFRHKYTAAANTASLPLSTEQYMQFNSKHYYPESSRPTVAVCKETYKYQFKVLVSNRCLTLSSI